MNAKVKQSLDTLVDKLINQEQLPGMLKKRLFLPDDIPSATWSLSNQLIMLAHDTADARGFWQWQKVGRYVKKGSKAFHILAPVTIKVKAENAEDGEPEETTKLLYFKAVPVFRYADTDGRELEYIANARKVDLEALPLIEVARGLGVAVEKSFSRQYYGTYSLTSDTIELCTDDEQTFLHELSHAVDRRLGNLKDQDRDGDEVVAELSACFLASLYGLKANMAYSKRYIANYSNGVHVGLVISRLLQRVIDIHDYIIQQQQQVA